MKRGEEERGERKDEGRGRIRGQEKQGERKYKGERKDGGGRKRSN